MEQKTVITITYRLTKLKPQDLIILGKFFRNKISQLPYYLYHNIELHQNS